MTWPSSIAEKDISCFSMKIHWGEIKACFCEEVEMNVKVWQREQNHPAAQNNESCRLRQDTTGVKEQTDTGLRAKCGKYCIS